MFLVRLKDLGLMGMGLRVEDLGSRVLRGSGYGDCFL